MRLNGRFGRFGGAYVPEILVPALEQLEAAFLDAQGRRYTGANVENASYNLGLCAERVALYHALTHGADRFVAVAIVTEAPVPTSPCGACRQALWEFAPHAEVLLVNRQGHVRMSMRDLLPHAFDDATLRATAEHARRSGEPTR